MNNLLQRMPQSAKVGLVAALLVALVGSLYYFAIVRPNQIAQQALTPAPTPAPVATPAPTATTPTPEPSAAATPAPDANAQASTTRSLEVVPLPFLVTESAKTQTTPATGTATPTATVAAKPESDVPPNPFVPLVVEADTTTPGSATAASALPNPAIIANPTPTVRPTAVASNPIPRNNQSVRVTQPQALGLPRLPTATSRPVPTQVASQTNPTQTSTKPPSQTTAQTQTTNLVKPGGQARLAPGGGRSNVPGVLSLGAGALPIRLTPLERELVRAAPAPTPDTTPVPTEQPITGDPVLDTSAVGTASNPPDFARVDSKNPGTQTLEPRTSKPNPRPAPTPTPITPVQPTPVAVVNPVTEYIQAQNLKLANVVLGATNIAIFQSREGYMVVPVGNTLPGSNILLKSLNTKEALLVQGSQEQNLSIENP